MPSDNYDLPEKLVANSPITTSLVALEDALARLDERARASPLRDGWMQRLLYHEACACQLITAGDLVHLDDLVRFDHGINDEVPSPPLSSAGHTLSLWRQALRADAGELLRLPRPGEATPEPDTPEVASTEDQTPPLRSQGIDADSRLAHWRRILSRTLSMPPTIAAAVAMDAWIALDPEERGIWRTALIGALVLRQRGKTRSFLLPIHYGWRFARYRAHHNLAFMGRVEGMLEWMRVAAERAEKDLQNLALAEGLMRRHLEGRRKNSRLKELAELLLRSPVVTIGMAAKSLGVSRQAVAAMIPQLGSTPRELTGQRRYRAWTVG